MSENIEHPADAGLGIVYSGRVPLEWTVSTGNMSIKTLVENEKCLRTILALSEYPAEPSEELAAMERKVDITLEMVAELLRSSLDIPAYAVVDMGAREFAWSSPEPLPSPGEKVDVAVYLHDLYPRPLRLKGTVKSAQEGRCVVSMNEQSEEVQHLIEKFIFLHHRRQVHQQRRT